MMGDWQYQQSLEDLADSMHPSQADADALVASVQARLGRPATPRWVWPTAGTGSLMAAAAALWMVFSPAAPRTLSDDGAAELASGVTVTWHGEGQVETRSEKDLHVTWESGRIDVYVPPEQGIHFAVETPEGVVRVVGTRFSVERDALGTHVEVERGTVEVTCEGDDDAVLTADMDHRCLRSAEAGLQHARQLQGSGASAEVVLGVIDRAKGLDTLSPLTPRELDVLAITTLEGSDPSQALSRAERYLEGSDHRASDVHRIAARLATASRDCERASPHLEALVGQDDAIAHVLLSDCVAPDAPERARALLERAQALDPELPGVSERLDRLP